MEKLLLLGKIFWEELEEKMKQNYEVIELPMWKAILINNYLENIKN